jgi:hypothetical protein
LKLKYIKEILLIIALNIKFKIKVFKKDFFNKKYVAIAPNA